MDEVGEDEDYPGRGERSVPRQGGLRSEARPAVPRRPAPPTPDPAQETARRTWASSGRFPGGRLSLGQVLEATPSAPRGLGRDDRGDARNVFPVAHEQAFRDGLRVPGTAGEATSLMRLLMAYNATCIESGVPTRPLETLMLTDDVRAEFRAVAGMLGLRPPPAPEALPDEIVVEVVRQIEARPRGVKSFAQVLAATERVRAGEGALGIARFLGRLENGYAASNGVGRLEDLPPAKARGYIADVLRTLPATEQDMIRNAALLTEREAALSNWSAFKDVVSSIRGSLDLLSPPVATEPTRPGPATTDLAVGVRARTGVSAGAGAVPPRPPVAAGSATSRPYLGPTCYACGEVGHKSMDCPARGPGPSATPRGPGPSPGLRFPNTVESANVTQRRQFPPRQSFVGNPNAVRAVAVDGARNDGARNDGARNEAAVRVELGGTVFGATPDTAMVGDVDVFMGAGAFRSLTQDADTPPEIRGAAVYEDVNRGFSAGLVYATSITLLDLHDGPYASPGTVLVPTGGDPDDDTVLLSQALLARAGVNVYDAFRAAPEGSSRP